MLGQRIRLLLRHSAFSFFINFNFEVVHILKDLIVISCYETVFTSLLILVKVFDYLFNCIIQTNFILNIHHIVVSDSIGCFSNIAFESVQFAFFYYSVVHHFLQERELVDFLHELLEGLKISIFWYAHLVVDSAKEELLVDEFKVLTQEDVKDFETDDVDFL